MLTEKSVADISLRELSDRVGLAKSNVLRYFDSREAIFLEVLDEECRCGLTRSTADWVGRARESPATPMRSGWRERSRTRCGATTVLRVARVDGGRAGAQHLGELRPRFQGQGDGEHPGAVATRCASTALAVGEFTEFFAEGALTLTAGMYPFSVPTEPVRAAMAEMGYPDPRQRFIDGLRAGLTTWLIGRRREARRDRLRATLVPEQPSVPF